MTILELLAGKGANATDVEAAVRKIASDEVAQAMAGGSALVDHVTDNITQKVIPALQQMLDEQRDKLLAEIKSLKLTVGF